MILNHHTIHLFEKKVFETATAKAIGSNKGSPIYI